MCSYPYSPLSSFILRTPVNPFCATHAVDFENCWFNDALRLASPALYEEKQKAQGCYSDKMKLSLHKYWLRSATRATPFGLFASCSVGEIGDETNIILLDKQFIQKKVRLDTTYMCSLVQYLESLPFLRKQMTYWINDSLYRVGKHLRFVDYYYQKQYRIHQLQEIEISGYLLKILEAAKTGCTFCDMVTLLKESEGVNAQEAEEFIFELIDSQILKSEIEVAITGENQLESLICKLKKKNGTSSIIQWLEIISNLLNSCDLLNCESKQYNKLLSVLDEFPIKYEKKYIIQADMFRPTEKSVISREIVGDIQTAISFLVRLRGPFSYRHENIEHFIEKFQSRFEEEAVPLLFALDSDVGVGYGNQVNGRSPLLDGLILPFKDKETKISLSKEDIMILCKYIENLKKGDVDEIELSDDDIDAKTSIDIDSHINTISSMFEIFQSKSDTKKLIYLKGLGGSTAASLLGRFCYLSQDVEDIVMKICSYEENMEAKDKIIAEIVHLPESRIGNISSRPLLRNYEIHYLSASGVPCDQQIPASDIMIQFRNNRLRLFSKERGKEIIPRLSNAHNFSYDSLPVYHFLCDYQMYNRKSVHPLYLERLYNILGYLPRIRYKNVILSLRSWKVDINQHKDIISSKEFNLDAILLLRKRLSLPMSIVIQEMDNNLLIDFNSLEGVRLFWSMLQKRKVLKIEEWIYRDDTTTIHSTDGAYCGEFILPFVKEQNYGKA